MNTPVLLRGSFAVRLASSFAAAALLLGICPSALHAQEISETTRSQIASLMEEKESRSPAQRKLDSQLLYFAKQSRHEAISSAVPTLATDLEADASSRVMVDFKATVTPPLLEAIASAGGIVVNSFAAFDAVRALLPLEALETLAARADVRFIEAAAQAATNLGSVTSQGDRTHRADTARATFPTNAGAGVKVGVLSDGVASLATSITSGNINANAVVLAGQAGSGDEGTAMMEIVQDLVPGAQVYFATAFSGPASFAANILALQAAGCSVIVDDVTYFNESPFQDQVISQAVNTVSAAGVMFFSCARNSGSKDKGTSGTWEGDFSDGGAATIGSKAGSVHNFGGGVTFNTVASGGSSRRVDLFWADPVGASGNDYDVFVTDATGAVLRSSTNIQSGTQDPYEAIGTLNIGERIVIVKTTAAAPRFLHLDTGRAVLAINTAGNVRGHNASGAANAFSVAATDVNNSPSPNFFVGGATNPVENFSSDGPRRMFFQPNGTPLTPGNFSSTGGTVLLKPDFTAADGGSTSVPGFTTFYGTSAAAPHAAAIAALLKSYNPALTPAQIRTLLTSTALDIEGPGYDRNSGSGIIMALAAIQAAPLPDSLSIISTGLVASGTVGGPFSPTSGTFTLTNTSALPLNWTASKTQPWNTLSATSGTLAAGASTTITVALDPAATLALPVGNYADTVTITNTTSGFASNYPVTLAVITPGPVLVFDSFTGATLTSTGSSPRSFMGFPGQVSNAGGTSNINVTSGTAYLVATTATSYSNVRLNIYFWGAASGATTGTTPAFSVPLGSFAFDLGAVTTVANTFYAVDFTLPSSIALPTQAFGVTVNWQGDTGGGLVSTDNLTSLIRYGAAPAVGTLTLGTAGTNGYYRNASGETDGNFLGTSFRTLSLANQGLALRLLAQPPDPAPNVTVTPSGTITNGTPITFTLTFSEAVTGLTSGEIAVTNGTVGTLTGSGGIYTVTVTPNANGAVTCQVPAGAAQDSGGNNNNASNVAFVTFDSVPPTLNLPAPITVAATGPSGAVVNYVANATDPGGTGVASFSAAPASGSTFAIGATTVNVSATDNAGNVSTGSFTVTVNANPGPTGGTFTVAPNTGVKQTDSVTLSAAGWTDPDLPLSYQFFNGLVALNSPSASSSLVISAPPAGSYTLKVRVTDAFGGFTESSQPLVVSPFSAIEDWRFTSFGSYAATGNRADTADFDLDTVTNLLEFAFGTDPTNNLSGPSELQYVGGLSGGGSVGAPGRIVTRFQPSGNTVDIRLLFNRRVNHSSAGLTYIPEFSVDGTTWVPSAVIPSLLGTDLAGVVQVVSVPYPPFIGGKKARFSRVRVIILP